MEIPAKDGERPVRAQGMAMKMVHAEMCGFREILE